MPIPPNPWFLKFLDGGNPKTYAIAAVAFIVGYLIGKGDRSHWKDVARSNDHNWHTEHGHHTGKYTERENDRNHHKHGEGYGR
jgi:hypothetical protein